MRQIRAIALAALVAFGMAAPAAAQGTLGLEKQILPMTTANWAAFRNYDGRQWIYFTHLLAYRCGLAEIRYSLNATVPDQTFPLPPCDPQNPNAIDPVAHPPYIVLPPGSAETLAIRVTYSDGEESETVVLAPCDVAGDQTCAVLVEADPADGGDTTPDTENRRSAKTVEKQ